MSLTYKTMIFAVSTGILTSALTFADVLPQASGESPSTPANTKTELAGTDTRTSSLRCWQYGKLLFEQDGLTDNKLDTRQPLQVFTESSKAGGRKLYLFELGSASCLYEKFESTDQPGV